MKPGDYLMMKNWPTSSFASSYCKDGGLRKGGIYLYDSANETTAKLIVPINDIDTYVEVGVGFLKQHFEISNRIINLNSLI